MPDKPKTREEWLSEWICRHTTNRQLELIDRILAQGARGGAECLQKNLVRLLQKQIDQSVELGFPNEGSHWSNALLLVDDYDIRTMTNV